MVQLFNNHLGPHHINSNTPLYTLKCPDKIEGTGIMIQSVVMRSQHEFDM